MSGADQQRLHRARLLSVRGVRVRWGMKNEVRRLRWCIDCLCGVCSFLIISYACFGMRLSAYAHINDDHSLRRKQEL